MLEAWPSRLLGIGHRELHGHDVVMYTRSIRKNFESSPALAIIGDHESLEMGECQYLLRNISSDDQTSCGKPEDLVLQLARARGNQPAGTACFFRDKTSGLPYHTALLAAGMLLEERFPSNVLIHGDFSRNDADAAQRTAAAILGRTLPLPIAADGPRLRKRLRAGLDEAEVESAFHCIYRGQRYSAALFEMLATPEELFERVERLAVIRTPESMPEDVRDILYGVISVIERALMRWRAQPTPVRDARRLQEAIVCTLADRGPRLTEYAWDELLGSTDVEELTWILHLVSLRRERHVGLIVRALLENARLRSYSRTYDEQRMGPFEMRRADTIETWSERALAALLTTPDTTSATTRR